MRSFVAAHCLILTLGLSLLIVGCDRDSNPSRSPTSEEDPARFDEAKRVSEEIRLKTQQIEKDMMKRKRIVLPSS